MGVDLQVAEISRRLSGLLLMKSSSSDLDILHSRKMGGEEDQVRFSGPR